MLDETESSNDTEPTADASSWEERQLCSDGNCVGVIGPDGRCKVCGLAPDGSVVNLQSGHEGSAGGADASDDAEGLSEGEADDLADRRLCPDGSCVGLLGEDNRCKICGQVGE
jgi:hypothetical protein